MHGTTVFVTKLYYVTEQEMREKQIDVTEVKLRQLPNTLPPIFSLPYKLRALEYCAKIPPTLLNFISGENQNLKNVLQSNGRVKMSKAKNLYVASSQFINMTGWECAAFEKFRETTKDELDQDHGKDFSSGLRFAKLNQMCLVRDTDHRLIDLRHHITYSSVFFLRKQSFSDFL